jgi:hypothetical protein
MRKKKDAEEVVDVESAEEKLGKDLIAEIAEKEWKTAPLPTEDELASETHKSPKARTNPNSRKNLIQYRADKSKEVKEEIVKGLQFKNKRPDIDPFEYISLPPTFDKSTLISFLPSRRVMKDLEEEIYFYTVLNSFLNDFDLEELSASDIEDVVSLSVNRVLENRLLGLSASDPATLIDVAATIEKFRKHSEKVKGNLASRRSDRIDPKNKQNYSIVDLVYAYDAQKKVEFNDRIEALEKEKGEYNLRKS